MKVDTENVIKLQDIPAAKSTPSKMNSLQIESAANRKTENVNSNDFLASLDGNTGCDCNSVEDESKRMPNNSICSSLDVAICNAKLKSKGELENSCTGPDERTISKKEMKSTKDLQNSSINQFDTSNSSAELNSSLESLESEKEDSVEEIIEITLSDRETNEHNADDCSYSSSSKDVDESSASGFPCSEASSEEVVNACLDPQESHHFSGETAGTDRDSKHIENTELRNSGAANRSSNGDAETTRVLKHGQVGGGTTEKQFLLDERSGSLKKDIGEQQDVSSDKSNVSSVEEEQNQVDSSTTLSDTNNSETDISGHLSETDLEVDKPSLTTSQIAASQPQNGLVLNEKSTDNPINCARIGDLEGKQNDENVNCFINMTNSRCELNKSLPSSKNLQMDVKEPSIRTTEKESEILTINESTSKVTDKQSDLLSYNLLASRPSENLTCCQSISPSSVILNAPENSAIPPVSSITLKPAVTETEPLTVSLPISGTISVTSLIPKIKENQPNLFSTISSNSITQEKSTSSQPVLVYQPVSKTTERLNESVSESCPASNMMVKLSGSLLARAQDLKLSTYVQSNLRRVCSTTEQTTNVSKTCTEQSDQPLSQFVPKIASNGMTDEAANIEVISASSSTSGNQTTDETNTKPDSVRPELSNKTMDKISDIAKKIKSEPTNDGYEKSSQNTLQNAELIEQGKIKTEPSTIPDEGKNKESSKLKSAPKPIALLPKVPIAFVNGGCKSANVVCSYLIPINSSVASSTYFQTIINSVSSVNSKVKKVTLKSGGKIVKSKLQQLRPLGNKKTTMTKAKTATKTVTIPDVSTEIPSTPYEFRVKSLDIANISELVQRKNLENLYKPPDPPVGFKCASMRCVCTECGDQFLLESSLRDHFQRCSMIIQYYCKSCRLRLLFTNKCSLLKHLRCHTRNAILSKTALQISADNISILSLLDGNMPKIEQPTQNIVNNVSNMKNPCTECGQETHLKLSHHFGSLGVICNFKHMCKICSMYLPTACSLRAHTRLHHNMQPFVCPECGMAFCDSEALKTHVDAVCYHFSRVPIFVCPICRILVPTAASLEQHFIVEHKNIYYTDKMCRTNFLTFEQWLDHKQTVHGGHPFSHEVNFYCQICKTGVLFKFLINHMHSHMSAMKQNVPFGYICVKCRDEKKISKIFISKNILLKHLELHKYGRNSHCPECTVSFVTDSDLEEHRSKYHIPQDVNICRYCSVPVDKMVKHHKHCVAKNVASMFKKDTIPITPRHGKAPESKEFMSFLNILNQNTCPIKQKVPEAEKQTSSSQFVCRYCKQDNFISFKKLAKHIGTHVRAGVLICNKCHRCNFKSLGEMKSHQIVCGLSLTYQDSVADEEEFRCEECDKYFRDDAALRRHVKVDHAFHPCHLCGLTYSTSGDLEQHVNIVHRGRKSVILSCQLCKGKKGKGKTFMRREFYYNHMATVHGVAKPADEGNDSKRRGIETPESGSPLKRLKVSDCDNYCCAKCDFSTEKSKEFSEHIAKHKKDSSSVQCPNCGLCFRVIPALKGHLFLVHKVKDVEQFIADKGIQIPEEEEDMDLGSVSAGGSGTSSDPQDKHQGPEQASDNPRQCSVCKRIFETEAEKNFHMRTHGMAFISSRRRQRPKPLQESDGSDVDVVNSQPNSAVATPEKSSNTNTQDSSKPSPISVAKRVKLSEKDMILQPANQPVVAIERIPTPDHTEGAVEKPSIETK